jgi:hypothetical protein
MLKKSFTLASAISLTGAVVWISTAACGGDETPAAGSSSSGSAGDSGASSSGSSSSSSSSSGSSGKDSGLVDPSTVEGVTIPYGKCEAFTKCDGSVEGSWKVSGGCLSDDTFDGFRKFCADLKEHDVVIKASGTVEATADKITQKTSIFLSAKIDVPKSCAQAVPFSDGSCNSIPAVLTSGIAGGSSFDHAECEDAGDLCKCAGDVKVIEGGTPTDYKTDGTGVLTTQSPTRNFEYCPAGDMITYRETTKDNKTFGMILQIKKQ